MGEHVDTICVQGGYQPGNGESRTPPIIQATTFKYTSVSYTHLTLPTILRV